MRKVRGNSVGKTTFGVILMGPLKALGNVVGKDPEPLLGSHMGQLPSSSFPGGLRVRFKHSTWARPKGFTGGCGWCQCPLEGGVIMEYTYQEE